MKTTHLKIKPKTDLLKYELTLSYSITLLLITFLSALYFIFNHCVLLVLIGGFTLSLPFEALFYYWYIRNNSLTITEKSVILNKGRLFHRQQHIPIQNIYMFSLKNNFLMNRINIRELTIQTLAKNYSFKGVTENNYKECLDWLSLSDKNVEHPNERKKYDLETIG